MIRLKNILRIIRKKGIVYSAGFMLFLVLLNEGIQVYSNHVLKETTAIKNETQAVKTLLTALWDDVVRNIDLGVRGYALTKNEGLLLPFNQGVSLYNENSKQLIEKLDRQGFTNRQSIEKLKNGYSEYIKFMEYMIQLAKEDNMVLFKEELEKDKGLALSYAFGEFSQGVDAFEAAINKEATERFERINQQLSIMQAILGIIGTPTLLFIMYSFVKDERKRKNLFEALDKNNRKYLFDPGTNLEVTDEQELINSSIVNFKKAAGFINQISAGNLEVHWEELNDENKELNKSNLAGELVQMREKMKQLKFEDAKRMWATEGLANYSEIVRNHQHDLKKLCEESVSYIVKYLNAQQGALFLLRENGEEKYLDLVSCHAFHRKKFIEKRIEIGEGLVGQVFLEKQIVKMTEIPQGYTFINSGLGEATPSCLMIIPMMTNDKVEAVLEIAGFTVYENYQMEWMVKIGEIMASSLISLRTTEKTQHLLEQFKEQTEQLRAQEEELRQNMEELEATQEEMRRKEKELERRYQERMEETEKKG